MGPCKGDLPVPKARGTTLPRRPTTHKSKYKVQKYSTSRYKSRAPAAASSRSQFIDLHYEYSRIAYESYSTFREPTVNLHCTRTAFKGAVQQLYGRSEGRTTVQLYSCTGQYEYSYGLPQWHSAAINQDPTCDACCWDSAQAVHGWAWERDGMCNVCLVD